MPVTLRGGVRATHWHLGGFDARCLADSLVLVRRLRGGGLALQQRPQSTGPALVYE